MSDADGAALPLLPGAAKLVDEAARDQQRRGHAQLGALHWLHTLLEYHSLMLEARSPGLQAAAVRRLIEERLTAGDAGQPLDAETAQADARRRAAARGAGRVAERDIADVVLAVLGYPLAADAAPSATASASASAAPTAAEGIANLNLDAQLAAAGGYHPRANQPTPTLDTLGRDLTRAAAEGKLAPIVGRAEEIQLMIETLCRRTKRNPALVGPAGVGKTAIVEGLAQRIIQGLVPEALKNCRVVVIQPSHVVAGASMAGEFEERMKKIISEASQDGLILFINEVHSLMGAGGRMGATDAASLLKPALARGDLACIAATTDDEYRRYIEDDTALERRFQPIRVHELSAAETLPVLIALSNEHLKERGVRVSDDILLWLIEFSQRFMRNRYLPDKAVDLLDQCIAYAHTNGRHSVGFVDAMAVAQRMVGMPAAVEDRLDTLREELASRVALPEEEIAALVNRLEVTVRGLDLRPARPNAVVLLLDDAVSQAASLAEVLAETITGSPERVITIDFSRFTDRWALSMLLGAGPGYVGYEDALPIHKVAQTPWCVLVCQNVEASYANVLGVLAQALADGFFTDATSRRIYLSDAVVVLTAAIEVGSAEHALGFGSGRAAPPSASDRTNRADAAARAILGDPLVERCDIICARTVETTAAQRRWLETRLLQDLAVRYLKYGVALGWEPDVVDWLAKAQGGEGAGGWEKLVDDQLAPLLIPHLDAAGEPYSNTADGKPKEVIALTLQVHEGKIAVAAGSKGAA